SGPRCDRHIRLTQSQLRSAAGGPASEARRRQRNASRRANQKPHPRPPSNYRIEWLSADGAPSGRNAAARKPMLSAIATNAVRSARSLRDIHEFSSIPNVSDPGFSFLPFVIMFDAQPRHGDEDV